MILLCEAFHGGFWALFLENVDAKGMKRRIGGFRGRWGGAEKEVLSERR